MLQLFAAIVLMYAVVMAAGYWGTRRRRALAAEADSESNQITSN